MLEIDAIDHIVLRTAQPSRLIAFYSEVLGCTIERETPAELGLTQLRAGSALIDIVSVDSELGRMGGDAPEMTGNNLDHFCLRLKAISEDDLSAHLATHGIAATFGKRYGAEGFGNSTYLKDPDGNTVELRSSIS